MPARKPRTEVKTSKTPTEKKVENFEQIVENTIQETAKAFPKIISDTPDVMVNLTSAKAEIEDRPFPVTAHSTGIGVQQLSSNASSSYDLGERIVYIHMKRKTVAGQYIALRNFDGKHPLYQNGSLTDVVAITAPVTRLNLDDPNDVSVYECAKDHPTWHKDKAEPLYTIEDLESNADAAVEIMERGIDAAVILKDKSPQERNEFARLFGINPDKMTAIRVYSALADIQKVNPESIVTMENDPDRHYWEIFKRAEARPKSGIIKENGNYKYNKTLIGSSFDDLIAWGKANEDLVKLIDRNCKTL